MQTMRGMECSLHPKEVVTACPILGEEILALVKAHTMNRHRFGDALVEIFRQTFGGFGTVRQARNFVIQVLVIQLGAK